MLFRISDLMNKYIYKEINKLVSCDWRLNIDLWVLVNSRVWKSCTTPVEPSRLNWWWELKIRSVTNFQTVFAGRSFGGKKNETWLLIGGLVEASTHLSLSRMYRCKRYARSFYSNEEKPNCFMTPLDCASGAIKHLALSCVAVPARPPWGLGLAVFWF